MVPVAAPQAPALHAVLTNLGVTAVVIALLMAAALGVAEGIRGGRHDGIDVVWGGGFALIAVVSLALSSGDGDTWRRWLVAALTVIWGGRLAWHIGRRNRGRPEDPRYQEMLGKARDLGRGARIRYAARKIYLLQGVLLWVVSLPVQLAPYGFGDTLLGGTELAAGLGVLFWLVGFGFEAVGDAQLARFRADPGSPGKVMDRGLWRYTRHPNYFGDACVWWGLTLLGLHHAAGLVGVLSAAVMTLLLTRGSGARLLESSIGQRRPEYADYVARTSGFIPLPPRRTTQRGA